MNRKCWPVVLLLVMLVCSFASASVLKSGGYVGPDTQWLQKSDRLMSIYSGQLSFWSNYTLTVPLSVPKEGLYKILISASGSPAVDPFGNKWPIMKLKVANREICTWLVEDQRQLFVSTAFKLPQGNHDAQIAMINDYNNGREDRNLFVYGLALASVRTEDAQPMVMFGGRPAAVYSEFMEGTKAVVEKRNVDPLYPAKRAIPDYTPTTKAPSEIGVRLENGLEYNFADFTVEESLDGQWKISGLTKSKEPFPEDVDLDKGYWQTNFNDSAWDTIGVPLDWYEKYPEARKGDAPYIKGWYRKEFNIPQNQKGKRVVLHFGVIGYEATLFVNGKRAGSHRGDFTPWEIDITDFVRYGERNTLAIRVLSDFGNWTLENERLVDHAYGSQWHISNIKGGIWQSVKVRYEEPVRFSRVLISPRFAKKTIEVDYVIENNSGEKKYLDLYGIVRSAMKGDRGEVANDKLDKLCLTPGTFEGRVEIPLNNPEYWSPDHPYLYYLSLALGDDRQLSTAKTQRFGFREFKAEGKHFYLNGERIYLFGENIPSVHYGGYEASQEEEMQRIAKIMVGHKRQGYNMLRNAHHPIVPYALELADEIGMMIYDEWAWCFTWEIDPEKFEKRNLKELHWCSVKENYI